MTLVELGHSAYFSRTAPAIVDFANLFEERVMSSIEGAMRVLHVSLADTRDCRDVASPGGLTMHSYLVLAHDPPRVLGLDTWRPRSLRADYIRWYANATRGRRQALRDLRSVTVGLLTTSRAAADRFGMGYVAPIGPMFTNEPDSQPTRIGVLGHLSPARKQEDVVSRLDVGSVGCDLVGRSDDPAYVAKLRLSAPDLRVLENLSNDDLAMVRSQWAVMVMPPSRAKVWSASAAVVDSLCSGVPIVYPRGSAVLAEYVGAAGLPYDDVNQLSEAIATVMRDQRRYQAAALTLARTTLAWRNIAQSWREYNRAVA